MSRHEARQLKERIAREHPLFSVTGPHHQTVAGRPCYMLTVIDPATRKQEVVLDAEDYERNFWFFLSEIGDPTWEAALWAAPKRQERKAA